MICICYEIMVVLENQIQPFCISLKVNNMRLLYTTSGFVARRVTKPADTLLHAVKDRAAEVHCKVNIEDEPFGEYMRGIETTGI